MKQNRVLLVAPNDSLLKDCPVEAPPKLSGNDVTDKKLLASAYVKQTQNLAKCNRDKQELRTWKIQQTTRFKEK